MYGQLKQNRKGINMRQTYPVSRLKRVEPETDEQYEVETILEHKMLKNGNIEYRIKWKDYPENESTWVKEAHLDCDELIQEHWANETLPAPDIESDTAFLCEELFYERGPVPAKLTKRAQYEFNWVMKVLFMVLIMFGLMSTSIGQVIPMQITHTSTIEPINHTYTILDGNFTYCNTSHRAILSKQYNCEIPARPDGGYYETDYDIIEKLGHLVDGYGYICEFMIIMAKITTSFWNEKESSRFETVSLMTPTACQRMVETKSCGATDTPMICIDHECTYHYEPTPVPRWWNTEIQFGFTCKITKRRIIADSITEVVAIGSTGPCYVGDLRCTLGNSEKVEPHPTFK